MPVEVQKQQRAPERILALVKFLAQLIVNHRLVRRRHEQFPRILNVFIRAVFDDVIEANQIAVDISEDIAGERGVKKHRTRADERLDQAFTLWQMPSDIVQQGVFPPAHFKKARFFFMLTDYLHSLRLWRKLRQHPAL